MSLYDFTLITSRVTKILTLLGARMFILSSRFALYFSTILNIYVIITIIDFSRMSFA
jgi:hypothetical protein